MPRGRATTQDKRDTARWLMVAIGSLMLAGAFSLSLVIARMPPFSGWITDPDFFRRCLVVHVVLALIVWFYAFVAGLFQLRSQGKSTPLSLLGPCSAALGVALLVVAAFIPHAEPVLANYVPVVDHPIFIAGLLFFGVGVLAALLNSKLFSTDDSGYFPIHADARIGLKASAIAILIAALTFFVAWLVTPGDLEKITYYELLAWGGGHVLQVASVAAMVSVWFILIGTLIKRPVVHQGVATLLFSILVTPHLLMPLMTLQGTDTRLYYQGATELMRWGIFPSVLVILAISSRALVRAYRSGTFTRLWDPRVVGFVTSAALTITGFILGAMIRGSNTMIPAHYHAAIGAVTVSFMAVALVLMAPARFGIQAPALFSTSSTPGEEKKSPGRWFGLQPVLFGVGQLVFACGFAIAGAHGMGRKVYGDEQTIRGIWDWLGLAIMGTGGLIAVAGGLLFIGIFLGQILPGRRTLHRTNSKSVRNGGIQ